MKILHLTLQKKWFDMEAAGIKKEEYREIKAYWVSRLFDFSDYPKETPECHRTLADNFAFDLNNGHSLESCLKRYFAKVKPYDFYRFKNGYHTNSPTLTIHNQGLEVGLGKPEWGAEPGKKYFVLKLGNIVNQ